MDIFGKKHLTTTEVHRHGTQHLPQCLHSLKWVVGVIHQLKMMLQHWILSHNFYKINSAGSTKTTKHRLLKFGKLNVYKQNLEMHYLMYVSVIENNIYYQI